MIEPERITVLGAASLRYGPTICGGLACYFGERPIEIHFWDPNRERLDLFDLFARYLFRLNKTPHLLLSTEDAEEALRGAGRIILALDEHESMLPGLMPQMGDQTPVLDLRHDELIPAPTEEERLALPHTIMRYLRGDDYAYEFLREQETSPVKTWLLDSLP